MLFLINALLRLFILASCCFVLQGCRKANSEMNETWNGGLITKQGTYKFSSRNLNLRVWIDQDHLVRYSIADAKGRVLLVSRERPSVYAKWFIFFDEKGRLWFESSDIGCSVARTNADGTYEEVPIDDEVNLIGEMPEEFFNRLPESIQRKWSVRRRR